MNLKSKNRVMNNFSMSGMTDIVFLLLIFFMLTSTLIAPNALKFLFPSRSEAKIEMENTVPVVTVDRDENIMVDGVPVTVGNLGTVLDARLAGSDINEVKFVADENVSVEFAVIIMNIAEEKNYEVVLTQF